jgi:hypothetical protein
VLIDVTVKVPEDRVADFYSMYGRWLAGPDSPTAEPESESDAEHLAWTSSDGELAKAVWAKLSQPAQALFSTLMAKPGHEFSGDELAEMLGIPNGKRGVAGVLAWPGRYCLAIDRKYPWLWRHAADGSALYWVTDEVADLFRQARES